MHFLQPAERERAVQSALQWQSMMRPQRVNPLAAFVQDHQGWIWGGLIVGGAFATGALAAAIARRAKGTTSPVATYADPPPRQTQVAFAEGDPAPWWPIASTSHHRRMWEVAYKDVYGKWHGNMSRSFMASRDGRYHVGIDLYANAGDPVLAPEDGTVVGIQTFFHGTCAMMIQGDSGVTILLGEIKCGSQHDFGVGVGMRVVKGQAVGRVGLASGGSFMLHFETYACCPTQNSPWYRSNRPPLLVRDPTDYLLRARAATQQMVA